MVGNKVGWYNILNSPNNQAENVLHNGCYTKVVVYFIYILHTGQKLYGEPYKYEI